MGDCGRSACACFSSRYSKGVNNCVHCRSNIVAAPERDTIDRSMKNNKVKRARQKKKEGQGV